MATQTGAMTTTNVNSNQLAIDVGSVISLLEPDVNILAVYSKAVAKKAAVNPEFKWLEDEAKARFDTTSAAVTSTATEMPVVHGTFFQQWDIVLNTRTGEAIRVDSVAGNTPIVTRAIGSTGTAMNEGDELYIIGTAQPENDTSKAARAKNPVSQENYTQIFRTPFEQSGTLEASSFLVAPDELDRVSRNAGIEHAKDIELSLLLGRKNKQFPGSTANRTTGGVLSFISSNQTDAGGTLSEAEFNAAMAQGMRYGSNGKLAMASSTAVGALNKFPASKQVTKNDETTYGMDVTHYTSPFGSLNLVYHKLLEGAKYGGYLIGVDIVQTKYRYLANDAVSRDTKLRPNIQPPDQDGMKAEYLSEIGLEFGLQRTHFLISGITG